jgi:hypothetical protein
MKNRSILSVGSLLLLGILPAADTFADDKTRPPVPITRPQAGQNNPPRPAVTDRTDKPPSPQPYNSDSGGGASKNPCWRIPRVCDDIYGSGNWVRGN